ncbi:MAG: DUF4070 domain-containing protein [Verrucomicrobia bacterium]|nr:DUF4070 domain-containing protein [Verrucomicrobiota bacterium]MCG2681943.1 DUF4070 domain-containing protein [Kiritimatiellia bacterium]MBU4247143.1 DUF4070 domain-containing protein [Verrucomicrobiota bacterium]MBU4290984.1 DUF4070 domain-containing protein [Verrucomicrobiota bacterium]MBU4430421.1 DUF4070 domain-containing protein [Verrucomicrobiota bacterium]
MKILLIYPEFPDTFWSFKHALKFIRKKAALPPLGLMTIAALLPENWSKRLVDLNVAPLTDQDLAWADMAFIGAMIVQSQQARTIISRCKSAGLKVVAGGPLFTNEHDHFEEVDHFILNEAELTLPPFLADLAHGEARRVYLTPEFADLRQTPVPLWALANRKSYASMSIQFSRGCPFQCDFCNITALLGRKVRTKQAAQIITEMDSLYELGWRGNIFFVDDNLIGNKHKLKTELLPALIEWRQHRKGITFNTEASIDLADDEALVKLMVKAGFTEVFIGIETPDDNGLISCSKQQNHHRNLVEDVKRIQRAGLQVQGGFIVGFDTDQPSIFQRQIDFIQKSGIVTAMVGLLQAPVGTKLYERLSREGRILGHLSGDNADGTTNIIPAMSLDRLMEGYKSILRNIYSPEHYYQRVRTFLKEYQPPKAVTRVRFKDMLPFFRSVFHLGITGRERFHYWKLLFWTYFHRPKLMTMAVTLAVYGRHFQIICKRQVR